MSMYRKVDRWDCSRPVRDEDWPMVFHVERLGAAVLVVCFAPYCGWVEVMN